MKDREREIAYLAFTARLQKHVEFLREEVKLSSPEEEGLWLSKGLLEIFTTDVENAGKAIRQLVRLAK